MRWHARHTRRCAAALSAQSTSRWTLAKGTLGLPGRSGEVASWQLLACRGPARAVANASPAPAGLTSTGADRPSRLAGADRDARMSAAAATIQELTTAKKHSQMVTNNRADRAGGKGSVGGFRQPTQIGARPDEFVPFRANPQQQAFAKLQPVLTWAGISTARAGRSGGPRVIGSTGTCDNGASSVFLALVAPPRCSRFRT